MREWTPIIIVAIPPLLGVLDIALYRLGGNAATFSWTLLLARLANPLVALATAYSFGAFCGHCYHAVAGEPPPAYEVVARMVVILSPTFYALVVIGAGGGSVESHRRAIEAGGQWAIVIYTVLAFAAGHVLGMLALPQHMAPGGV